MSPTNEVVPAAEAGLAQAVGDTIHSTEQQLASEQIVVSAPMSFAGSAERIWKLTKVRDETAYRIALGVCATTLIAMAWTFVVLWYVTFGLLLVPYRLVRRGQRKRKREAAMHRELLAAVAASK